MLEEITWQLTSKLMNWYMGHGEFCISKHKDMMTSSHGNILRITGHLCEELTGHQWIPHTKASDAELWCFLWSVPE